MPKRISKQPKDPNQAAHLMVSRSTGQTDEPSEKPPIPKAVSKIMAEMGRRGGKIGGKRRLETMTAEQRSQIALKAARAKWAKKK